MKNSKQNLISFENYTVNLPWGSDHSPEAILKIQEFLLTNYKREDINDANGYQSKYWIYDQTPNEIRVYFYTNFDDQLVVDIDGKEQILEVE